MKIGVLVVAKAPVIGRVKTRIARTVGDGPAARLAAAALVDTLETVEACTHPGQRVIALSGDLSQAVDGDSIASRLESWSVVPQRGKGLAQRLVAAHVDAAAMCAPGSVIVQIGMDTPHLTERDIWALALAVDPRESASASALGPATDGGWWGLATRSAELVRGLGVVPMSTPSTCRETARALARSGSQVDLGRVMTDMDTWSDAVEIAALAPGTRLAACVRRIVARSSGEVAR